MDKLIIYGPITRLHQTVFGVVEDAFVDAFDIVHTDVHGDVHINVLTDINIVFSLLHYFIKQDKATFFVFTFHLTGLQYA